MPASPRPLRRVGVAEEGRLHLGHGAGDRLQVRLRAALPIGTVVTVQVTSGSLRLSAHVNASVPPGTCIIDAILPRPPDSPVGRYELRLVDCNRASLSLVYFAREVRRVPVGAEPSRTNPRFDAVGSAGNAVLAAWQRRLLEERTRRLQAEATLRALQREKQEWATPIYLGREPSPPATPRTPSPGLGLAKDALPPPPRSLRASPLTAPGEKAHLP